MYRFSSGAQINLWIWPNQAVDSHVLILVCGI
jgi:hypothetical protein